MTITLDAAKKLLALQRSKASIQAAVKRGDYPQDFADVYIASIDADIEKLKAFSSAQRNLPISEAKRK